MRVRLNIMGEIAKASGVPEDDVWQWTKDDWTKFLDQLEKEIAQEDKNTSTPKK